MASFLVFYANLSRSSLACSRTQTSSLWLLSFSGMYVVTPVPLLPNPLHRSKSFAPMPAASYFECHATVSGSSQEGKDRRGSRFASGICEFPPLLVTAKFIHIYADLTNISFVACLPCFSSTNARPSIKKNFFSVRVEQKIIC